MTKHINRPAAGLAALVALLGLAACVTPQIQKTTVAPAPTQPASVANAPPAVASKKLQELLETQLLCPGKATLAIALTRATAMNDRVIARQGNTDGDGSITYPVMGDLVVYGLKITALKFSGDDNSEGASIMAVVKATTVEVTKIYKSRQINVKKSNVGPGLWARRPLGLLTGVYESDGALQIGCVVPID